MNRPFSPESWHHLQVHAAAQLSPAFADNVLRAARVFEPRSRFERWMDNPFAVACGTAAACLLTVILYHGQATRAQTQQHLADWHEISIVTASLEASP